MKTFAEFYNESKDELNSLAQEAIKTQVSSQENLSPTEFASKILTLSRTTTLDTLRVYHEWISEQLDK